MKIAVFALLTSAFFSVHAFANEPDADVKGRICGAIIYQTRIPYSVAQCVAQGRFTIIDRQGALVQYSENTYGLKCDVYTRSIPYQVKCR